MKNINKCLLPFFLLFVSCSLFDGSSGASITIKNQTASPIYIYDFSSLKNALESPVEIKAGASHVFESERLPEQYTFKVKIGDVLYDSETRYVQDWRKFSIVLDKEAENPHCIIDKDGRELELKPVAEPEA